MTRVEANLATGTADFVMTLAPGVEAQAWMRTILEPGGARCTFTQMQPPGMPDELFDVPG